MFKINARDGSVVPCSESQSRRVQGLAIIATRFVVRSKMLIEAASWPPEMLGERAVVAGEEMLNHMRLYERSDNANRSEFEIQIQAAIEQVKDFGFLIPISGSNDLCDFTNTDGVLGDEEIKELKQQLKKNLHNESSQENI